MLAASPLSEVADVPTARRRFFEKAEAWIAEKQRQGKYAGRNGSEARRFFRRCSDLVPHVGPESFTEDDLWTVIDSIGGDSPKTRRWYLTLLGNLLSWCGNPVVQRSGILERFPNRASRLPVVPADDRDAVLEAAVGQERVLACLLGVGRRRVEVQRARIEDFRLDEVPATYRVRQKGGHGEVTDSFVLTPLVLRELAWYLPLRSAWSGRARTDSGHLVCRSEGRDLVGVSERYLDRLLWSAEDRAGVRHWPAHSFRRSAATLLRARGADWEDVSVALGHRSPETTRLYVEPLVRRDRVAKALELLDPLVVGRNR